MPIKQHKTTSTVIRKTSVSLSLPTESLSNIEETTTMKIQRRRKPTSSKLNKSTSKSKRRSKPTKPANINTKNTLSSSTQRFSEYSISKKKTGSSTESYSSSKKPSKRRRKKKPQKFSTTTTLQPVVHLRPFKTSIQQLTPSEPPKVTKSGLLTTMPEKKKSTEKFLNSSFTNISTAQFQPSTKKPSKKLKKKTKQRKSTKNSTVTVTSKSIPQLLGTTQSVSTTTYKQIPTYEESLSHLYVTKKSPSLKLPTTWMTFNSPLISENPQVQSPPTTITALDAPFPCPYYLNRLFSRSTSTTTTTTASPTPPSSCKSTGKYPSQNCHEYFECLKVMWWYRLMILKCKKGEGFDATLLQCIPDETCV
nr:uncharacterized protein PB18E9.04c-like [Leptinotarsa decemlineata]